MIVEKEDVHDVISSAAPALSLLFIVGTAGTIPSMVVSAVLRHLVEELRNYAVKQGADMRAWDDMEGKIFDGMDSTVMTMPKDTVFQKGGDA